MEKKVNSETRFIRYIKSPIRVLSKLRDSYINSMIKCAGHTVYGGGGSSMGCPAPYGLPKSFSVNSSNRSSSSLSSSNDDYSELIRAASIRTLGRSTGLQQQSYAVVPMVAAVRRSQSVAIGRINEDEACDFADDLWLLRSKSYAVA
ncbi:uncharacterized protein LOC124936227 [Impatiens glandulifera]|uniref:uncharacterized protein LOC124936227 n=1 Tax=Impatiens glandulifera TaxID=253017 RepID=UPI001FB0816B|nr:uncharacterized protein LOC124936227 [Impatiens glandulifera]